MASENWLRRPALLLDVAAVVVVDDEENSVPLLWLFVEAD